MIACVFIGTSYCHDHFVSLGPLAFLAAVFNFIPVFSPGFAPDHLSAAALTVFLWQVLLLDALRHYSAGSTGSGFG